MSTGSKKINGASISNNPGQQPLWKKRTAVYDGTVMNVHVPNVLSGTRWSSSLWTSNNKPPPHSHSLHTVNTPHQMTNDA